MNSSFVTNRLLVCSILLFTTYFLNAQPCNSWLRTPSWQSFMRVGDLDVPGTTITVEATFNRTTPYSGTYVWAGDLVSKHNDPTDCNYLLRPNNAEITTSNGFFITPPICQIQLNKTYHVAMTYDGTRLRFYRNGFLMSSVPATGNLYQNNWLTKIGIYDAIVNNTQFLGFINEVRIWNVVRTQAQIRAFMGTSLPSPTTQTGLLAYYTFDNLQNKQGNAVWNGTLGGAAAINQTNTSCAFVPDSCGLIPCASALNFNYYSDVDVCSPLTAQFQGVGITTTAPYWSFGDGNTSTGILNPSHTYATPGTYLVRYSVTDGVCTDTINGNITVGTSPANIILTPDTTICLGTTKRLRTQSSHGICWTPTTFLDDPTSANPVTSTPQTITYYFNAETVGTNLINNGDFSQGNTGFSSTYVYSPSSGQNQGVYTVSSNIPSWNPAMPACVDHTTGNGNMMLVNGASVEATVWSRTVTVQPNTNYALSCWLQNIGTSSPAQMYFSINDGPVIGNIFAASNNSCVWQQVSVTWNSGIATSARIAIVDQNHSISGNDFALDDISFAPLTIKRDSVKITVDAAIVRSIPDTTICKNSPVQLTTSGAQTYSWTPGAGLSNTSVANPVATPAVPTTYYVAGTTAAGCVAKDTVDVRFFTAPIITITQNTTICTNTSVQLQVTGGNAYNWSPAATLSNNTIANPVASPSNSTLYYATVTDGNNCNYLDSVLVQIKPLPVFTINAPVGVCPQDSIRLLATGGTSYSWQPDISLSNTSTSNPMASPTVTTTYSVTISEPVCNISQTLSTSVTVLPLPSVTASRENDIDCTRDKCQLMATGASSYSWSPALSLDNSNLPNPIASPQVTTQYLVTGTDINGCTDFDTVSVKVEGINKGGYYMPNAFTPNGDGLNDCFGISFWGVIQELDFSIFNRWGERVFYTTDRAKCWDGTFKGVKQDGNVFVYMIKAKTICESNVFRKGTFVLIR